jgi:hypothetical protein
MGDNKEVGEDRRLGEITRKVAEKDGQCLFILGVQMVS